MRSVGMRPLLVFVVAAEGTDNDTALHDDKPHCSLEIVVCKNHSPKLAVAWVLDYFALLHSGQQDSWHHFVAGRIFHPLAPRKFPNPFPQDFETTPNQQSETPLSMPGD